MTYKILIVDDEKDIVEMVQKKLLAEGFSVTYALSGKEALAKVKTDNPDIVLLDLGLPDMNGCEVLKQIRKEDKDKWRPVIIISAQSELESVKKCYELEADHYLTKPCSIENILRGVRTMISLIPHRISDTMRNDQRIIEKKQ